MAGPRVGHLQNADGLLIVGGLPIVGGPLPVDRQSNRHTLTVAEPNGRNDQHRKLSV
jgi:hypothetical protein